MAALNSGGDIVYAVVLGAAYIHPDSKLVLPDPTIAKALLSVSIDLRNWDFRPFLTF